MSTREEVTNGLLAIAGLRKLLDQMYDELRQEALEHFTRPGQREPGEVAGKFVGHVQLTNPGPSWEVWDQAAWTQWVKDNHPEALRVDSNFTRTFLARLKRHEPVVDEATGEVIVPDGIAAKSPRPSLRVDPTKDAPQIVLDALGDRAVLLGLVAAGELEAGDAA